MGQVGWGFVVDQANTSTGSASGEVGIAAASGGIYSPTLQTAGMGGSGVINTYNGPLNNLLIRPYLFANGEQGWWYDPSDVNLAWRRNLLTFTEQFDVTSVWTTSARTTVSADTVDTTAPNGTNTADKITATAVVGNHPIDRATVSFVAGLTYTISVFAKAGTHNFLQIMGFSTPFTLNGFANFDLSSGSIGTVGSAATASIQSVGDGWYRCTIVASASASGSGFAFNMIQSATAARNESWTPVGTETIYLWGAQLEVGSLTPYQQIVTPEITYVQDVQPLPILYQDAAGTTPVTAVEQPCSLMLDKRLGLTLGSELVTNGTFDTDSDWTKGSGWTISAGKANYNAVSNATAISQTGWSAPIGTKIVFTVSGVTGGTARVNIFNQSDVVIGGTFNGISNGTYSFITTAAITNGIKIYGYNDSSGSPRVAFSIDDVSVKVLFGNHAFTPAAASTARPTVSARVNKLVNTEWSGAVAGTPGTVPTNWSFVLNTGQISAVNGNQLTFTTSASRIVLGQSVSYLANSVNRATFTVHANSGLTAGQIFTWNQGIAGATESFFANGVSQTAATYVPVPGDVLSYRLTLGATAGGSTIRIGNGCAGTATGVVTLSKPDIRELNDGVGLPDYQRVNTATDYDVSGFPVYLRADGSNDYMLTNSIDFGAGATNAPLGSDLKNTGVVGLVGTATAATYNTTTGAGSVTRVDLNNQSYVEFTGLTASVFYKINIACTSGTVIVRAGIFSGAAEATIASGNSAIFYVTGVTSVTITNTTSAGTSSFTLTSIQQLLDTSLAPDKVTLCAGVRKLSDAAFAPITELSVASGANNGTFAVFSSNSSGDNYQVRSRGTVDVNFVVSGYAAPITNVLTMVGDIASPLLRLSINGTVVNSQTANQGTGNYGNYPVYLFSRAGTSFFFNGRFYGSVGRGAQSNDQQIAALEGYMNTKTAAY